MTQIHENQFPGHETADIGPYANDAYLSYAMAVVLERALPCVSDGQKPVQRRILHTMSDLRLTHTEKPVKCARIVGDALGKYHPHGDASVYDALVRQAQPFSLRYPLIAGQGNFGSRDGDSAAAMRYTEARLSTYAQLLLKELHAGTVDFKPNYDGAFEEPVLLPSRLPMLLLNGASGIAVGMASEIFPHNLGEVASAAMLLLDNPTCSDEEFFKSLPGPDFPSGGQLISSHEDIVSAYTSGRGTLRLRARWKIEELARGQWQVVVSELPYGESAAKFKMDIDKLSNPIPPAGKKQLTPKQLATKAATHEFLDRCLDESSKDEEVRIVIHPRTSKIDVNAMMDFLLANTCLESSVSLNFTVLDLEGRPRRMAVRTAVEQWITYRLATLRRRSAHELQQVQARAHLLEGRIKVTNALREVLEIIQTSDDPKTALIARLGLSDIQATDILDTRLRALSRIEGEKLQTEAAGADKRIQELNNLLNNESALKALMAEELMEDTAQFSDARRTLLKPDSKRVASTVAAVTKAVVDEPLTVILTKRFALKALKGHKLDLSQLALKNGDELMQAVETRSIWPFFMLSSDGRVFTLDSTLLPSGRMDPVPASTLVEMGTGVRPLQVFSAPESSKVLFTTEQGLGLTVKASNLVATRKAGKAFLDLGDGDAPLPPVTVPDTLAGHVAMGSSDGRMLVIELEEVKERPTGGKGVQLMTLKENEQTLRAALYVADLAKTCLVYTAEPGQPPAPWQFEESNWADYRGKRARSGKALPSRAVLTSVSYDFE